MAMARMHEGLDEDIVAGLSKEVVFPKRLGRPEEFAEFVRLIAYAPYLSGSTIRLDGGLRTG